MLKARNRKSLENKLRLLPQCFTRLSREHEQKMRAFLVLAGIQCACSFGMLKKQLALVPLYVFGASVREVRKPLADFCCTKKLQDILSSSLRWHGNCRTERIGNDDADQISTGYLRECDRRSYHDRFRAQRNHHCFRRRAFTGICTTSPTNFSVSYNISRILSD